MPRIIVTADPPSAGADRPIMFAERVSTSDFESLHFQTQLVERLGWAVGDADAVEHGQWDDYDDDAETDERRHDADRSDQATREREAVLSGRSS